MNILILVQMFECFIFHKKAKNFIWPSISKVDK